MGYSEKTLEEKLRSANEAYRAGNPVMDDSEYDRLTELLREINPENNWLKTVEPEAEGVLGVGKVVHKAPMLSTEKAYSAEEIEAFVCRVEKQALEIGVETNKIVYRVTPKLDGLAGYRKPAKGVELATRGNGLQGEDVSEGFKRLQVIGNDVEGAGEIVMPEDFFQGELKTEGFKTARNFMVGLIGAETLKDHHWKVIAHGMGHFVAYQNLDAISVNGPELIAEIESISAKLRKECRYATDGVVIEVINDDIKKAMGSTSHHHRWQIAFKKNGETAETVVHDVVWQTGRTGRVTPVIEVEPVELSGATIRRATAHTARMIAKNGIGKGAVVRLVRSGDVIPKIEAVVKATAGNIPEKCPCCGSLLQEDGEYLLCNNDGCAAQAEGRIIHFFKTLGTADGFGPKAAEKLVEAGITRPVEILRMGAKDFEAVGFGVGESANLAKEVGRCLASKVEDWRFLAAFGIRHLGRGDSRHLLKAIGGMEGLDDITPEKIMEVEGFAEKTASSIYTSLMLASLEMEEIQRLGIPLESSKADESTTEKNEENKMTGYHLVFTGTFSVPRNVIETEAANAGAVVQSAVNKKTTALVIGDKVGSVKTEKARSLGVQVWTEEEYRANCA